jgi:hypothetical protein
MDDFMRLDSSVKGLDRDKVTIKARFEHEGIGFLSVALSSLCDSLDRGLADGRFACPYGFKRNRGEALPKLFSGLLCKVFNTSTGKLKEVPDVGAIKCLREALRLFKKCKSAEDRATELHRSAVSTFWDAERRCEASIFDDARSVLLSRVSGYLLPSLDFYCPEKVLPKHGPGAVFEKVAGNQKWSTVYGELTVESPHISTFNLESSICHDWQLDDERLFIHPYDRDSPDQLVYGEQGELGELIPRRPFGECARLVSVAKNATSRRTITVEPLMNMFIQQGLNSVLRESITKCKVLSSTLALTDQSKNQHLAMIGSRTGEWSTLDLSAASDLLSLKLVKIVFNRHPLFLEHMLLCRSDKVFDDRKKVARDLSKFAGMGNALTFPVQSTVFACIAISCILFKDGYFRPSYRDVKRIAKRVRVYGDDIIVPTNYARDVIDWINSFGLLVNQKKSFFEGNFRESCGVDAFQGYDVTPLYLRFDPDISPKEANAYASFVSTSNQAWMRGLYKFATDLADIVESGLKAKLPLIGKNSGALGWHSRVDACDAQKWDPILQRLVLRAPCLKSETYRDRLDGYPALLKFYLTPLIQRGKKHLKISERRFSSRIIWRWMPTEVG